jgi:FMN phosphatase YigB (HAD superfamily)
MEDFDSLCLQEKLLRDRINITSTLISIVASLRKTKSRSKFIYHSKLRVTIYQFEPSHYLEFLDEGSKSSYAKVYEEYKELKKLEKERKKANEELGNRMK